MSFLPSDLASWALRGVRGRSTADDEANNAHTNQHQSLTQTSSSSSSQQQDEQDIRAKRLARLSVAVSSTTSTSSAPTRDTVMTDAVPSTSKENECNSSQESPMDVDTTESEPTFLTSKEDAMTITTSTSAVLTTTKIEKRKNSPSDIAHSSTAHGVTTTAVSGGGSGAERRRRRKKELLLQKALRIVLVGGCVSSSDSLPCVIVDIGEDPMVTDQNISEIIASRLALPSDNLTHIPVQVMKTFYPVFTFHELILLILDLASLFFI